MIQEYKETGVAVARKVISLDLIETALDESRRLLTSCDPNVFDQGVYWKKQRDRVFLEKFEPVIDRSEIFNRLSEDIGIIALVGALLSDSFPKLLKDKLIYKAPGQDGYPLHQDYNWWHSYPAHEICTAVIPLEPSHGENGGIEFYLGCHDTVYLPEGENRPLNTHEKARLINKPSTIFDLNPGDVLIFHSLTPHFSGRNMSASGRTQFYPTYCSSRVGDVYQIQLQNHKYKSSEINESNIYEAR